MEDMDGLGGPYVAYPVRDLLGDIKVKLDHIDDKLDGKADAIVVQKIESRINDLERRGSDNAQAALREVHELGTRVSALETDQASGQAVRKNAEYLDTQANRIRALLISTSVAVVGTIISLILGILQLVSG